MDLIIGQDLSGGGEDAWYFTTPYEKTHLRLRTAHTSSVIYLKIVEGGKKISVVLYTQELQVITSSKPHTHGIRKVGLTVFH